MHQPEPKEVSKSAKLYFGVSVGHDADAPARSCRQVVRLDIHLYSCCTSGDAHRDSLASWALSANPTAGVLTPTLGRERLHRGTPCPISQLQATLLSEIGQSIPFRPCQSSRVLSVGAAIERRRSRPARVMTTATRRLLIPRSLARVQISVTLPLQSPTQKAGTSACTRPRGG